MHQYLTVAAFCVRVNIFQLFHRLYLIGLSGFACMCSDLRFGLLVEGCWQCLAKSGIEASLFNGMSNMGEDLLFGFLPDYRHAMVGGLRLLNGYQLVEIRSLRDQDSLRGGLHFSPDSIRFTDSMPGLLIFDPFGILRIEENVPFMSRIS